jgi:hypothetical protein
LKNKEEGKKEGNNELDFEEDSGVSYSEMYCLEDGNIDLLSPIEKLIKYCRTDIRFNRFDTEMKNEFLNNLFLLTEKD